MGSGQTKQPCLKIIILINRLFLMISLIICNGYLHHRALQKVKVRIMLALLLQLFVQKFGIMAQLGHPHCVIVFVARIKRHPVAVVETFSHLFVNRLEFRAEVGKVVERALGFGYQLCQQLDVLFISEDNRAIHLLAIFRSFPIEEMKVETVLVYKIVDVNIGVRPLRSAERGKIHIDVMADFIHPVVEFVGAILIAFQFGIVGDFLFEGAHTSNNLVGKRNVEVVFVIRFENGLTVVIFRPFLVLQKLYLKLFLFA